MNSGTLAGSLIFAAVLVMLIAVLARLMMRGWRRRSERQAELLGDLPDVPEHVSSATVTTRGLYVGATLSPAWNERVTVGDLGYRSKAVLTRYPSGIMVERARAQPIWIPTESIAAIRMERGVAGKVVAGIGILAIRWRLPSGTEIDVGFRADNRDEIPGVAGGTRLSKAVLVLEDGRVFTGRPFGATGQALGEAVFSTGMSGYQETLTDPSYHRQIVVATAPQIGNTGWNGEDSESRGERIWVAGYAVRDPSPRASNWRATGTLEDELIRQRIVGIAGIDTRAVVRHLRSRGSMKAGVFSDGALAEPADLIARVRAQQSMLGADLAGEVSTAEPYVVEPDGPPGVSRFTVAALDLGIKTNTPRNFARRGIRCHVLPASTTFEQIAELNPHGVFLSNGPGDPATADHVVALTREVLGAGIPLFGICFGNQILGRALGLSTYKMVFGHRGINIPVVDHATGRVAVTAQNHGFALQGEAGQSFATPFGPAVVSHTCANDGVVEGVKLVDGRAFSVQYHPEAAAGPHDAEYLFDQFVELMAGEGR
ncbi:carbamoyl-phosphate synthase small subunit [Mycobacterium tuberculosis]|nr:carbamoyl-phosphate synthase small subunit [Mycobacterium tuberculosis]